MLNKKGQSILFCNGNCYNKSRDKCPNARGIYIGHLDIAEDHMEYDGYLVAHIYCPDMGEHEYFRMREESKYYV